MTPRPTHRRAGTLAGSLLASLALAAGTAAAGTAGAPGIGDPYYPTDGNGGYDALDYDVNVAYDPPTRQLDGDTTVTAAATQDLDRFNLDLTGLTVHSVRVNGAPAQFSRSGEHELSVTPPATVDKGDVFRVEVTYAGVPQALNSDVGTAGWQISQSGGAFAAGEPHSASTWYPVNDHPQDKAQYRITARVPQDWKVVSNGREVSTNDANGWTTSSWATRNPMASYLSTIGIDRWDLERSRLSDGTPVINAYAPGAENAKGPEHRLPEVLDFLSSKFGPYPHAAAGGIFLADPIDFSLETQGRPTYTSRGANLTTIVHEQAHQWYGDSVSVHRWRDVCLNECVASYAQWMWDEDKEHQNLDDKYRQGVARATPQFWSGKLVDMGPGNEFSSVYTKGKLAMHALRRQIGDDDFDRLLHALPALHRNGNATWEQFEQLAERISGQDLNEFFQQWFHGNQKPDDEYLWPGGLDQDPQSQRPPKQG